MRACLVLGVDMGVYGCECERWVLCCVCCGFSMLISDSLE